jgi:hypothetical protein
MVRRKEQQGHPPLPQRLPVHYAGTQVLEGVRMAEMIIAPRHGAQRQEVESVVFDPWRYLVR